MAFAFHFDCPLIAGSQFSVSGAYIQGAMNGDEELVGESAANRVADNEASTVCQMWANVAHFDSCPGTRSCQINELAFGELCL